MSDLDYLTDQEKEEVKKIYPKIESSDDGVKESPLDVKHPEDDKIKKVKEEVGYTDGDYEKKTKESDRLQYSEDEIQVEEEMIENG